MNVWIENNVFISPELIQNTLTYISLIFLFCSTRLAFFVCFVLASHDSAFSCATSLAE